MAPDEGSAIAQRAAARLDAEVDDLDNTEGAPGDRRSEPLHPGFEQEVVDEHGLFSAADPSTLTADWELPSALPEIPPRQGFVQRWVRMASFNAEDSRNQSMKSREGWRARDPKTIPGMYAPPLARRSGFGNVCAVEGMVLCEMPKSRAKQRKAFFDARRAAQDRAVDEDINRISGAARPGIGRIEKTANSRVTTSRRPLRPQPDDETGARDG